MVLNQSIIRQTTATEPRPSKPHTGGPEVLCAGLWRTGTSSLQAAFEQYLGFVPCLHGAYMVTSVEKLQLFYQCCVEENTTKRRKMLADWFDHYPASTDLPGFAFVDDLIEMYPNMKIILNKRKSAETWLKSVKDSLEFYSSRRYLFAGFWDPLLYWHHQIYVGISALFQRRHGISRNMLFSVDTYERHNSWVKDLARKHNRPLLEYEVGQGWAPLVTFLEIEAPSNPASGEQMDFPHSNEANDMRELQGYLVQKGLKAWAVVLAPVIFIGIGLYGIRNA